MKSYNKRQRVNISFVNKYIHMKSTVWTLTRLLGGMFFHIVDGTVYTLGLPVYFTSTMQYNKIMHECRMEV